MSIQSISRYISGILSIVLVCCGGAVRAQNTADTTATDTTAHVAAKDSAGHQLCIGFDITHPIINSLVSDRDGYEFAIDYYFRKELYFVAEGGWGGSHVDYTDLKYTTSNSFFRVGINKSLLVRNKPNDWDMMFIGLRYGMGFIQRSAASYTVVDSLWGNVSGTLPDKSFIGYWAELTGGMRVELAKGLCAGWTIRGKFLLNTSAFKDLAPLYVAGYGKGDKNAVFDFNLYISYAIRWRRQHFR